MLQCLGEDRFASIGGDETGFEFEGIHFPEVSPSAEESSSPLSPSLSSLLPPTISENLSPIDTRIGLSPLDGQAPSAASRNDRATLESTDHIETFEEEDKEQAHSLDDDVAASFLTALGLGLNQPRFSEQDQIQERATLTEEERRSILVDMFGDKCSITEHQSKRRQSDTDGESISFLVKQMRAAIDMMQANKKEALLEALVKASPEEFSDSRLEQFLRSDGMNPEVSALVCDSACPSFIHNGLLTCLLPTTSLLASSLRLVASFNIGRLDASCLVKKSTRNV